MIEGSGNMRETLEFMAIRTIKRKEEEKGGRVKKGRMGRSFMCFIVCPQAPQERRGYPRECACGLKGFTFFCSGLSGYSY